MHEHIKKYLFRGFRKIKTDSGTGSHILIHKRKKVVVKFNQDPAYDKFVEYILRKPSQGFPVYYLHEKPVGEFIPLSNEPYTVTELELLCPLRKTEQEHYLKWNKIVMSHLQNGGDFESISYDPFTLNYSLSLLFEEAKEVGVNIDWNKSSNFMARVIGKKRKYVISDGFN